MRLKDFRVYGAWMVLICAFMIGSRSYAQAGQQAGGPPSGAGGAQAGAEEHPLIDAVHISGITKLSEGDLLKIIPMKAGGKLSRALIQDSGSGITAEYKKKGGDVAISPNITHPSDGHVVVELIVDEKGTGGFHWPSPGGGAGGPGGPGGSAPSGAPPTK